MINVDEDLLPRDSLITWYSKVDKEYGQQLYEGMDHKLSGNRFVKRMALEKVVLPGEWKLLNKLLNDEKIKQANYILVDFWYTSCIPCLNEIPALNAFHEKLAERDGIVFLSINADHFVTRKDKSYVKKIMDEKGVDFPVFFDDEVHQLTRQLKVNGYPAKFILDAEGYLVTKADGSDMTLKTFESFY